MQITEVTPVSDEVVEALGRLIPQLPPHRPPPGRTELVESAAAPRSRLFVARDPDWDDHIVGTLAPVLFRTPTGLKVRIMVSRHLCSPMALGAEMVWEDI